MERNHQDSSDVHKSEVVGLFKVPGTQVDIKAGHWKVINPTQNLDNSTVVEFAAEADPFFTDLTDI